MGSNTVQDDLLARNYWRLAIFRKIYQYRIPGNLYFTLFLRIGEIKKFMKSIFANSEFEAMPTHNIDYSMAHARARGTYFYKIKFLRLKENLYNSQKFCTLKITRCTVLNSPIINNYGHTHKSMTKLEKKDKVARITNIKSANCFLQQIHQILLLPINRLVRYISYISFQLNIVSASMKYKYNYKYH